MNTGLAPDWVIHNDFVISKCVVYVVYVREGERERTLQRTAAVSPPL